MKFTSRSSKLVLLVIVLVGGYFGLFPVDQSQHSDPSSSPQPASIQPAPDTGSGEDEIARAFANRQSDQQVRLTGRVERVLSDDRDGSRHQRFILRFDSGHTLLVAHNIELAPRVEGLRKGDRVELYGEYEWNQQGGVIHWTHRDHRGSHPHSWIRHQGKRYD